MLTFILSAVASFFLYGWITSRRPTSDQQQLPLPLENGISEGILERIGRTYQLAIGIIIFIIIFRKPLGQLISWVSIPYLNILLNPIFSLMLADWTSNLFSEHETIQFLLGGIFGSIMRLWWPAITSLHIDSNQRLNWWAIFIFLFPLAALIFPYGETLLRKITGIKTPFVQIQFAGQRPEEHLLFQLDREPEIVTASDKISGWPWAILGDLDYQILTRKSEESSAIIQTYKENRKKHLAKTINSANLQKTICGELENMKEKNKSKGIKFLHSYCLHEIVFSPLGHCIDHALSESQDIRQIQTKYTQLVSNELRKLLFQDKNVNPDTMLREVKKATEDVKGGLDSGKMYGQQTESPCFQNPLNYFPGKSPWVRKLVEISKETPYPFLLLGSLSSFAKNYDQMVYILTKKHQKFSTDLNVNAQLAYGLYYGGRELKEAIKYLQNTLDRLEEYQKSVSILKEDLPQNASSTQDDKYENLAIRNLEKRFNRGLVIIKAYIAYYEAQAGIRENEALRYGKDSYEQIKSGRVELRIRLNAQIIDYYGYAKMIFGMRKDPPDFEMLREAKILFEEAISEAEKISDSENGSIVRRARLKLINEHLRMVNRLFQ